MRPGLVRVEVQALVEEIVALQLDVQAVVLIEAVGATEVHGGVLLVQTITSERISQIDSAKIRLVDVGDAVFVNAVRSDVLDRDDSVLQQLIVKSARPEVGVGLLDVRVDGSGKLTAREGLADASTLQRSSHVGDRWAVAEGRSEKAA